MPISGEQLDLLDSDLLVVQPIGKTAADVRAVKLFQTIPAVEQDRYVILDDPDVAKAFSLNSPLFIQYAIDVVMPLLAAKTT